MGFFPFFLIVLLISKTNFKVFHQEKRWKVTHPGHKIFEMAKDKGDTSTVETYDALTLAMLSPIASPLSSIKLKKKLLKLVKKATKDKNIKRGIKEVTKAIRKDVKGYV